MKKIYIVLTRTGTILSHIIGGYTKAEFTHSSLSLDIELNRLYSFGRLNPNNPFIGGFVHEGINFGTFKKFKNTYTRIYELEVTEKQYEIIENTIYGVEGNKNKYGFNILGLFAVGFNIKRTKLNSFYCAEFVKYLLDQAKVDLGLPDMIKPEDFKYCTKLVPIYEGKLKDYVPNYENELEYKNKKCV